MNNKSIPIIEFVSYDGKYPCLCMGTLTIKVNGKLYYLNNAMCSGGHIGFDDDWNEEISSGPWSLDLNEYSELLPYKEELTTLVNNNVRQGCCGGCI